MEKYKSVYPTLRQAKTKWSSPSIIAKQGEGPSHGWYEMMRKDARAKLAASIQQSKLGSITRQQKIVHEEAGEEHLYHVTHTKHVGKIQKQGLRPMQTSNWVKAGDKERYGSGEVYTFTHKDDAHQWAGRMDWAHHQKLGSGNISIVTIKKPTDHQFEVDTNDPLSQAGQKGKWLKTHTPIAPHHIVSVEKYAPKKLGESKDRIGKPTPSAEQIAKKHGLTIDQVNAQLDKGVSVEREHTNSDAEAREIARDHVHEFPDYYDRLDKMETKAKKDMKEETINEVTMTSSGPDAKRHAEKYITPYVGQKETHTLKRDVEHIPANSKVTVHGHTVIDGKHHAIVSGGGSSKKVHVPFSNVVKPVVAKNKGLDYESSFVKTLNKHGLMSGKGAGATSGNDFHLINKTTGEVHHGKVAEHAFQGESKKDLSAAYGQASLSHHPKKGWHFSDKTKERFPHYTAAVEKATVTVGKNKVPLLHHINTQFGAPNPEKKSSNNVYSDHTNLHPAHAYMKDHGVDVLHIGSHGTYRAGLSHHKDRTPLGLPKTEGVGRYRVRQKHRNSLTVQFNIRKLEKSSVHLDNPEHLHEIKKKLGHVMNENTDKRYDPEKEILKGRIETHKEIAQKMASKYGAQSPEAAFHRAIIRRWERELGEDTLKEDVANSVGGGMSPVIGGEGNIHGMDPIMGKPIRRKKFGGRQVFVVDPTTYYKAYLGKRRYEHYEKYLEGSPMADEIREYGRKYWDESIVLENEQTGAMLVLKYGRK